MDDESKTISVKTWVKTADVIFKNGYRDGAADGQLSTYQKSFDLGYEQGLQFGINIGIYDANERYSTNITNFNNRTQISGDSSNCQICSNGMNLQQNIMNIFNHQKEYNEKYLQNIAINNTE